MSLIFMSAQRDILKLYGYHVVPDFSPCALQMSDTSGPWLLEVVMSLTTVTTKTASLLENSISIENHHPGSKVLWAFLAKLALGPLRAKLVKGICFSLVHTNTLVSDWSWDSKGLQEREALGWGFFHWVSPFVRKGEAWGRLASSVNLGHNPWSFWGFS